MPRKRKTGHAAPPLSSTGERLLRIAGDLSRDGIEAGPTPLSEFVQTYREWIATNRGRLGTQHQQAEAWQLICHAMISARDVREAIHLLIRFGKVIWQERGPSELREEGETAVLVFSEPYEPGPEGLIAAIWQLALTLSELEFLTQMRFREAEGRVMHAPCLAEGIERLLFAQPIVHGAGEIALVFARRHLDRPVVARAADLPRYFRELLPLTLGVRGSGPPRIETLVAGLIRDDKRGPEYRESSLETVAMRLGMSVSALRRRLTEEGTRFRIVRDGLYDELAREMLRQREGSVEEIAARLGFSDGFSFRRFFRRLNGVSPSAFRAGEAV